MTAAEHQRLGAALAAADRGWRVFPLRPGDKRPVVRAWEDRATSDPDRIRTCWTAGPYNVGIACGPSGLLVIDLDVPKGADRRPAARDSSVAPGGRDVLAELAESAGQPFPADTYTVGTCSGGTHLYFAAPPGEAFRNTAGRIGPLIDTRAHGGYVVGAGSVVGDSPYRLTAAHPVAPLPHWLVRALAPDPVPVADGVSALLAGLRHSSNYAATALKAEVGRVQSAEPGTRNSTLNAASYSLGQLVGAGLLPDEPTAAALADAAKTTGLRDREIHATVRSGLNAGARNPRAIRR